MRVDEIGDIDRQTGAPRRTVHLSALARETRFPFVINLPQQDMEPALAEPVARPAAPVAPAASASSRSRIASCCICARRTARRPSRRAYLLGCDGGRSTVREQLGIPVEGQSLPVKYSLVDLEVDLDRRKSARLSLPRLFFRRARVDDPGAPSALLALPVPATAGKRGAERRGAARQGAVVHRRVPRRARARQGDLPGAPSRRHASGGATACS